MDPAFVTHIHQIIYFLHSHTLSHKNRRKTVRILGTFLRLVTATCYLFVVPWISFPAKNNVLKTQDIITKSFRLAFWDFPQYTDFKQLQKLFIPDTNKYDYIVCKEIFYCSNILWWPSCVLWCQEKNIKLSFMV